MSWRDYLSDLMLRPPTAARLQQEELYQTERELAQEASLVEEYGFLLQRSQARLEMLRLRHQRLTEAELARRAEAEREPITIGGTVALAGDLARHMAEARNVYGQAFSGGEISRDLARGEQTE